MSTRRTQQRRVARERLISAALAPRPRHKVRRSNRSRMRYVRHQKELKQQGRLRAPPPLPMPKRRSNIRDRFESAEPLAEPDRPSPRRQRRPRAPARPAPADKQPDEPARPAPKEEAKKKPAPPAEQPAEKRTPSARRSRPSSNRPRRPEARRKRPAEAVKPMSTRKQSALKSAEKKGRAEEAEPPAAAKAPMACRRDYSRPSAPARRPAAAASPGARAWAGEKAAGPERGARKEAGTQARAEQSAERNSSKSRSAAREPHPLTLSEVKGMITHLENELLRRLSNVQSAVKIHTDRMLQKQTEQLLSKLRGALGARPDEPPRQPDIKKKIRKPPVHVSPKRPDEEPRPAEPAPRKPAQSHRAPARPDEAARPPKSRVPAKPDRPLLKPPEHQPSKHRDNYTFPVYFAQQAEPGQNAQEPPAFNLFYSDQPQEPQKAAAGEAAPLEAGPGEQRLPAKLLEALALRAEPSPRPLPRKDPPRRPARTKAPARDKRPRPAEDAPDERAERAEPRPPLLAEAKAPAEPAAKTVTLVAPQEAAMPERMRNLLADMEQAARSARKSPVKFDTTPDEDDFYKIRSAQ